MDQALHGGEQAETKAAHGQPYPRREALEEDVRGDLEDGVRHEEDSQCRVELRPRKLEVFLKGKGPCIGDVDPVEEGQEVQDADEGEHMDVDLGLELLFGGVRRAPDTELIVVDDASCLRVGVENIANTIRGDVIVSLLGSCWPTLAKAPGFLYLPGSRFRQR